MVVAKLSVVTFSDFRVFCFFLACFIYAFLGSPTPNTPGLVEFVVGVLLIVAVGAEGCAHIYRSAFLKSSISAATTSLFFVYGLSVPLLMAFLSGHDVSQITRDVLPFLFLFCPLFFTPLFRQNPERVRVVLFCLVLVGLVFSVRSLLAQTGLCGGFCGEELLYLENMPTVLFSGLFLVGLAIKIFMHAKNLSQIFLFFAFLVLASFAFLAEALTLQRASLGAFVVYIFFLLGFYLYTRPQRSFVLFVLISTLVFLLSMFVSFPHLTFGEILGKTALVGLNNRPQEAAAVWDAVAGNPFNLLFGLGWGAHFNSPAVGGLSVNFTHNFFTTMLLKTGLCGLIFSLVYIAGLARVLVRSVFSDPVLGLALAAPFLIDITLYASFKSLDFGLTLLMISLSLLYSAQSESSFQSSKSFHASSDHTLHEPGLSSCPRRDGEGFA